MNFLNIRNILNIPLAHINLVQKQMHFTVYLREMLQQRLTLNCTVSWTPSDFHNPSSPSSLGFPYPWGFPILVFVWCVWNVWNVCGVCGMCVVCVCGMYGMCGVCMWLCVCVVWCVVCVCGCVCGLMVCVVCVCRKEGFRREVLARFSWWLDIADLSFCHVFTHVSKWPTDFKSTSTSRDLKTDQMIKCRLYKLPATFPWCLPKV